MDVGLIFVLGFDLVLIVGMVGVIRRMLAADPDHAGDISTVWYFFSLAFVVSFLVMLWGVTHEAFSPNGEPQGQIGKFLTLLRDAVQDVGGDMAIIGSIVAVILVPQWLNYVLSGLFGCAARPWLTEAAMKFMVWSAVKFCAVLGGVMASFVFYDPVREVRNPDAVFQPWAANPQPPHWVWAVVGLANALVVTSLAFPILGVYRRAPDMIYWIAIRSPAVVQRWLKRYHAWATRHRCTVQQSRAD